MANADKPLTDAPPPAETPAEQQVAVTKDRLRFAKLFWAKTKAYVGSRKPSRGVIIFVTICVAILLGLGTWQMARLHQKNALMIQIKDRLVSPLADLTEKYPSASRDWEKLGYQPLVIKGTYASLHRFKLIPRTYEGQAGYQLILPLQLSDQQMILINRGFVPDGQEILPPPDGKMVEVQGVGMMMPTIKQWQTPENIPSRNQWTWIDVEAIRHEVGVQKMAPLVVYETRDPNSSEYPIGGQLPMPQRNKHGEYAMTWYMLACVLLFIAFIASGEDKKKAKATGGEDGNKISDPVAERGMYPEATD